MSRLALALTLASTAIASGPALAAAARPHYINPEKYLCVVEAESDTGRFSAIRELSPDGTVITAWTRWGSLTPSPIGASSSFGGFLSIDHTDPDRILSGSFHGSLGMGTRDAPTIAPSQTFRLELTTHQDGMLAMVPAFSSRWGKWKSFAHSRPGIWADWADVYAMGKGSGRILIVARNRKGELLHSARLPFEVLEEVQGEILRLSRAAFEKSRDYRSKCIHEEANNEIVV